MSLCDVSCGGLLFVYSCCNQHCASLWSIRRHRLPYPLKTSLLTTLGLETWRLAPLQFLKKLQSRCHTAIWMSEEFATEIHCRTHEWARDRSATSRTLLARFLVYHPAENDYRYRSEIKSKTIGLYQITDVTDLYKIENNRSASKLQTLQALQF